MAIVYNWATSATLAGARDLSRMHRSAKQEDLGWKIEQAISAINDLQSSSKTNVSAIVLLESGLSAITSAVLGIMSNLADAVDTGNISNASAHSASLTLTTSYLAPSIPVISSLSNFRA